MFFAAYERLCQNAHGYLKIAHYSGGNTTIKMENATRNEQCFVSCEGFPCIKRYDLLSKNYHFRLGNRMDSISSRKNEKLGGSYV